ncbi:hypothetical protein QEW_4558 [Clostridioides difficile CD160]|nr:hypothetical protein QEW_4558 [Clostridioides difficile CD160]
MFLNISMNPFSIFSFVSPLQSVSKLIIFKHPLSYFFVH